MKSLLNLCAFLTICVIGGGANNHYSSYNNDLIQAQGHRARHDHHSTHLSSAQHGIICYQCNSEYDPRCGDPFDPYSLGTVNCSMRPSPEHLNYLPATICRKTIQKVYGKTRVVRGCGYVRDEERDDKACVRRSGTHDVFVFYCSCTGSLCNGADSHRNPSSYIITLLASVFIYAHLGNYFNCIY